MEWIITLLIVGALLIAAETLLPGLIVGITGVLCLLAGVIAAYTLEGVNTGNTVLLLVLIGLIIGAFCWVKYFPTSKAASIFISNRSIGNVDVEQPELLHQRGTAFSALRPAGSAVINGRRVDVVAESGLIDKGAPIEVVAIEGMRVVVRRAS